MVVTQPRPRVALVTGGAIRVGRAIALRLAGAGMDVAITYRSSDGAAREAVSELRAYGRNAHAYEMDLEDLDEVVDIPRAVVDDLGGLDVLVQSASVFDRTPVGTVAPEDWDHQMDTNAKGPFFLAQAAAPYMESGLDPNMIHVLDTSVERPFAGYLPYTASKAALWTLTRGLARALAPTIRVNGVAPGPVLPPDRYDEAEQDRAADATLMGRWGAPEDVAAACLFLAKDAPFTTGAILPVDGGRHIA